MATCAKVKLRTSAKIGFTAEKCADMFDIRRPRKPLDMAGSPALLFCGVEAYEHLKQQQQQQQHYHDRSAVFVAFTKQPELAN